MHWKFDLFPLGVLIISLTTSCTPEEPLSGTANEDSNQSSNSAAAEDSEPTFISTELLEEMLLDKVGPVRCAPYLQSLDQASDGAPIVDSRNSIGQFIFDSPLIYLVDNIGKKMQPAAITKNALRNEFGAHNLLVECTHGQFGTTRLFVPRIGEIDTEQPSQPYSRPDWLAFYNSSEGSIFFSPNRDSLGSLSVTVASDFIYELYLRYVETEIESGRMVDNARSVELLGNAKTLATSLFGQPDEALIDWEHVLSSTHETGHNTEVANQVFHNLAGLTEQFRALADGISGGNREINRVSKELASRMVENAPSLGYGDRVGIAFGIDETQSLVSNAYFHDGWDGWERFENTTGSDYGYSYSYLLPYNDRVVAGFELTSNIPGDAPPLQTGMYQQIDVSNLDLTQLYLRASIRTMQSELEQALAGLEDAAGVATVSIEFLNASLTSLGTSNFLHTKDPTLAGSGLAQAPVALETSPGFIIHRIPGVPNRALIASVGDEARRAVGSRFEEIAYVRLYALASDYVGGDFIRHWFLPIVLVHLGCNGCEALIEVDELNLLIAVD